jgi:hypothetical protein
MLRAWDGGAVKPGDGDATVGRGADPAGFRVDDQRWQVVCGGCGKVVYEAVFRAGEYGREFVPADGSDANESCHDHARTCTRERTPFERFAAAEGIPRDGGGVFDPATTNAWLAARDAEELTVRSFSADPDREP